MKRTMMVASAIVMLSGCAGNKQMIQSVSQGTRHDVFQRMSSSLSPQPGNADLHISSTFKTHREDMYLFGKCSHGKPDLRLLLNIDGQMAQLTGEMKEEKGGYVGKSDPEAGSGIRYVFNEHLRLKPGMHSISVALPDDDVALTKETFLKEGKNILIIAPVYGQKQRNRRIGFLGETTFYRGIKALTLVLKDN